jgi:hypothetical protein
MTSTVIFVLPAGPCFGPGTRISRQVRRPESVNPLSDSDEGRVGGSGHGRVPALAAVTAVIRAALIDPVRDVGAGGHGARSA